MVEASWRIEIGVEDVVLDAAAAAAYVVHVAAVPFQELLLAA